MLKLNDYKDLIDLNGKINIPQKSILSSLEKEVIVNSLLSTIQNKFKIKINLNDTYVSKRLKLRGFLNQLPPYQFEKSFFDLQDKLLSNETIEKQLVHLNDLTFKDGMCCFQGDITTIATDAIVNAGNSNLLGCFVPLHNCIDNIIISAGGFQIRNDLSIIMKKQAHKEPIGCAKVTNAYNLPSKYIFHTVGPCIYDVPTQNDKEGLKNCYLSCLELAKEMKLKSISFCCISTGEFNFPNDIACDIAVDTTKEWLKENNYDLRVVFNVFKDIDRGLYESKLRK